jgi:urease gamma subunit
MLQRSTPVRVLAVALLMVLLHGSTMALAPGGDNAAAVKVECTKASALIQINIQNHRKIGNVVLEIRDEAGRSLYREEGKAMSTELVRKLDKGVFPKGAHTLTVSARDFSITQELVVE